MWVLSTAFKNGESQLLQILSQMQGVALIFKSPFKRQKYCKNIVILNSILTEVGDLLWQVLPSNVATWFFMVVFLDHATVIIMTTTVLFVVVVGSCSSSSFLSEGRRNLNSLVTPAKL